MTHYHGPNYYRQSLRPVVIDPVERLIETAVANKPKAFAKSLIACDNKFDGVNAKATPEHPANLAHNVVVTTRNALAKVLGDSDDCAWTAAEKAALFIDKACIDGEKQFGRKPEMPAYHDPTHYLTVALGAMATGLADHIYNKNGILTRPDVTDLFVAGLVHDFLNPGGSNRVDKDTYKLFAFERVTWESVKRLLSSSGYEGERLERMRTIVFATDPECGAPLAEMALDYHYSGNDPAKQANLKATAAAHINKMSKQFETKEEKRQLQALYKDLFADRRTAEMAGFLTHNDIALSTLSEESYLKNTRKLDMEYIGLTQI